MGEFLRLLASLSLSGAVLTAAAACLNRLLRGRVPRYFLYYLWLLVLARFLCPIGTQWSLAHRAVTFEPEKSSVEEELKRGSPFQTDTAVSVPEVQPAAAPPPPSPTAVEPLPPSAPTVEPARDPLRLTGTQWIMAVWGAGAALSLCWYLTSYWSMCKTLRSLERPVQPWEEALFRAMTAGERSPRLRRSAGTGTPMAAGLLRPVICLPERELAPEELRYALSHELVHWRRHDLFYKWAVVLTACIHWFNPAAWYLVRAVSRDCELSCDEAVVRGLSRQERAGYGEMLLKTAAWRNHPISDRLLAPLRSQKRSLQERLCSIMKPIKNSKGAKCLSAGAILAVLAAFTMLGAYALQIRPGKLPDPPTPPPVEVPGLAVLMEQGWSVEDGTSDGESVFILAHREGQEGQSVLLSRDGGTSWNELALPEPVYVDGVLTTDMESWNEAGLQVLADLPQEDITLYGLNLPKSIDMPGVLLRHGSRLDLFPCDQIHTGIDVRFNSGPRLVLSDMALADYDGDGTAELAVSNCVGTGTGCEAYELYIFEPTGDGGFSVSAALTQEDLWAQMDPGLVSAFDAESLSYGIWKEDGVYRCDLSEEKDWILEAPTGELAASDMMRYRLAPLSVHVLLRPCDMPMCDVVWYNNALRYDGTSLTLDPQGYALEEEIYPLTWHKGESQR